MSTIGEQRATNYALLLRDEDTFVAAVTADQPAAPAYFGYDAARNKADRPLLDDTPPPALSLEGVLRLQEAGATVLDTREPNDFAAGHVAGAINVGLSGRYAEYAGSVLDPEVDVVLVTDPGHEAEAKTRLARIGYDRVVGHLAEPAAALTAAPEAARQASRLDVDQLAAARADVDPALVDVRNPGEVERGPDPGGRAHPPRSAAGPARRARRRATHRRLLRQRVPLLHRRQPAPGGRLRRRLRPQGRVQRLVGPPPVAHRLIPASPRSPGRS